MTNDDGAPSALELAVGHLRCPICGLALAAVGGTVRCAEGHSFDVARQGYVSFLTGHPGVTTADTAEMVAARARFLTGGFYNPIADAVRASTDPDATGVALEIGGGTGFYLARLLESRPELIGIDLDLSAPALRVAARTHSRLAAIAADAWLTLPIADAAASIILSVFSPRNAAEMHRVIRPDGRLIVVSPSPRHLGELVSSFGLVTVDEHKTERLDRQFASFEQVSLTPIEYQVTLEPDDVRDVVLMGPSARHVDRARLGEIDAGIAVTVSVELRVYSPTRMTAASGRMGE